MSTSFPKSKEKRSRTSSEPNKSFVKNVTSRVSGLLPATITKWFSSPSSNTNGSTQVAEATDSSTEDEAPESPITTQPPAKKIRYTSPGELSQHLPVETRCTSTNTETVDESYTVLSPIVKANSREESIFASTRVQSANDDTTEETKQDIIFKQQHSLSAIEPSTTKKRKSLFGNLPDDSLKKHCQSQSGNLRDPYFKPSLLSSPFYVGRTMYGGATSSYLTPTSFKKKSISLTNETKDNDSVTMSHSARRVMDLLEHYSSPLIEAKRIPQITREPEKLSNNSLPQSTKPYGSKAYSYKTQELHVPSVANILTIKRKSRLMDSTNAARQIIASHSSSSEYLPYSITSSGGDTSDEITGDKLTTKVKSRLTRTNRERNIEMESAPSDTVNLPNVVLQIDKDNLPKFTFGPISSQPQQSSSIQTPVIITPEALKRSNESEKSDCSKVPQKEKTSEVKSNNDCYKFSTPVPISNIANKDTLTPPKFSFGSPDKKLSNTKNLEEVKTKNDKLGSNTSNETIFKKYPVIEFSGWKCDDCWVTNKKDDKKCVCCGAQQIKPNPGKLCSICKAPTNRSLIFDTCFECDKNSDSTWKCRKCWTYNRDNAEKCVSCGLSKENPASEVNSEKNVECEWTCDTCWIKNKSSLSKCAACGGIKPGSQAVSTNNLGNNVLSKDSLVKETQDNTFKNIAKAQKEKWECPLCLVRNESDRDICICCEASKPGTEKESHTKFNFHQPSEITFKFGIQPKTQETCTNIEPEECNMGEESETNNNILPKTTSFNFGLSVKNLEDKSQSKGKVTETPKINFTFGVSKVDQIPPGRNNIFGIPSKPVETGKRIEENPQEVPQAFPRLQSNEPVKKDLGLFNTPVTSQVASEMPGLSPMQLQNQNSPVKKDLSFLGSSGISTTSSEATSQSTFTFSSIMPATNMFVKTTTISTCMANILGPLSVSTPASTTITIFPKTKATTTTSSFFKKTDPLPTLGQSLFSKTDSNTTTTTTTTTGPLGTMQPIFSFGGQGPPAPQAEKPKFNFSFTSNQTESAAIFKPAFGVTSDNSVATNNFNLPSNTILGGNTLSGNPLNTTTQMNTANPLTTGNSLTTPSGSTIFGSAVPKENMWSTSNNNMFASNNTTNGEQKPPTFTFGAATAFSTNSAPFGSTAQQAQSNNSPFGGTTQAQTNNISFGGTTQQAPTNNIPFGSTAQQAQPNNNAPFGTAPQQAQSNNNVPFGGTAQQAQQNNNAPFGSTPQQAQPNNNTLFGSNPQQAPSNNTAFGTTTQQPQQSNIVAFGGTTQQTQPTQPPQNVFGMGSQTTTSQPTMFGSPMQSQSQPNIFGGLQVANNPMHIFGAPNQVPTPSFGALNPPIPTFETSSLVQPHPAPAAFNFGGQPSTGIFGFGQQNQAPSQQENPGMYGFGGPPGAPRVQFTIGSAPDTTVRRVRKATRRTQR